MPNKEFRHIDNFLKRFISKKYDFIVLTLPGLPIFMNTVSRACVRTLSSKYPDYAIKKIMSFCGDHGNKSNWLMDRKEFLRVGKRAMADRQFVEKVEKDYKLALKKFFRIIKNLETNGIDRQNLKSGFKELSSAYLEVFGTTYAFTGTVTHAFSDYFITKFLKKYKYSESARRAMEVLSKSSSNFINDEENDLRKIADQFNTKIVVENLTALKNKFGGIYQLLQKHQGKYYWINNNYKDSSYLSLNFFFKKLIKLKIEDSGRSTRKEIFKKGLFSDIDHEDIRILKTLGRCAGWQDIRKKANLLANYWLDQYLRIFAKKFRVSLYHLRFASLKEIYFLIENGNIDVEELKLREKGCALFTFIDKEYYLSGKNYELVKKRLQSILITSDQTIKGVTANGGQTRGKVKVIINVFKERGKMKQGDILVTSMTRPEFVPLMRLAKAIVTDESGITSHAAVLAREFGIPCVVGTKIATQVLKDGDLVEVDANRGWVKKVN